MIGAIDHIAVAVPDLAAAIARYRDVLGAAVTEPVALPGHGVTVAFVGEGDARTELLEPLGEGSPIAAFLERHPKGGMHHVCYRVADVGEATARLEATGARTLGPARTGAHGVPVVFLHPGGFDGVLIELQEGAGHAPA